MWAPGSPGNALSTSHAHCLPLSSESQQSPTPPRATSRGHHMSPKDTGTSHKQCSQRREQRRRRLGSWELPKAPARQHGSPPTWAPASSRHTGGGAERVSWSLRRGGRELSSVLLPRTPDAQSRNTCPAGHLGERPAVCLILPCASQAGSPCL